MGWFEFIAAYGVFFLSHLIPVRPPLRPWLQDRLGRAGFTFTYSLLSVAVLAWLVAAAGRAPHVPLWGWAPWQVWVPLVVMLPVCVILALSIARPNPFSFGGARDESFDPARPGITRWTRHPLLAAITLWSVAHVVPNGDLAHVILFGTFALFALAGRWLIDRRKRRGMGARWDALRAATAAAALFPPPVSKGGAAVRLAAGAGLYALLLWLHPWLFGVSPLP